VILLCGLGVSVGEAADGMYRMVAPDGTVHLTNAPGDPRYRRMAGVSGTSAGWLRLPAAEPGRYAQEIAAAAARYGVPPRLVEALIRVESAFNPTAVSRKGARGLMQLMPTTAFMLGVQDSFNPRQNIDGGVRHLRSLMDRYPDDLTLVLAAYNAGEGAVRTYNGVPPFPETRRYVERVLGLYGEASPPAQAFYVVPRADGSVLYTNILQPARSLR
jgi:soluble lytic murein transglycosylase-like protein